MSPRHSVLEARSTRQRILERSVPIASAEGLEALTIGRLATELGLSKAGILGHFGTKESLQIAVVETARDCFVREVPQRVRDVPPGLARLRALCEAWVSYLERDVPPGGCFFCAAAAEFDGRDGPVRDAVTEANALWQGDLRLHVRRAITAGELPQDTDAGQLIYEIVGTMLALNHFLQLQHERSAAVRARRSLERLLGEGTPRLAA